MADQWEIGTLAAINERTTELGLPALEWSNKLESDARNYWTQPALCPSVANSCNCPHRTSPKRICDLLWNDDLASYFHDCEGQPMHPEDSTLIRVRELRRPDGIIA